MTGPEVYFFYSSVACASHCSCISSHCV